MCGTKTTTVGHRHKMAAVANPKLRTDTSRKPASMEANLPNKDDGNDAGDSNDSDNDKDDLEEMTLVIEGLCGASDMQGEDDESDDESDV
jgi:hypothetical protein